MSSPEQITLRKLMEIIDLKYRQVATLMGVDHSQVWRWVHNPKGPPAKVAGRLAMLTGTKAVISLEGHVLFELTSKAPTRPEISA